WQRIASLPDTNIPVASIGLTPQHLAYVIYTSGSTGKPKGVMVQHAGITNLALLQGQEFGIDRDSRVLQFTSLSFDVFMSEFTAALCNGASLYLASREELMPGEPLLATMAFHRITHASMPPVAATALPVTALLPHLRSLVVAGEACPAHLVRQWADRVCFVNAYGPTEATVYASAYRCRADEQGAPPIGRPIANTRLYILDAHQQPVPIGVPGELYIGGAGVAR
ncbi:AMP-binding protein, partial [Burkholderia cepacia]|uniref:AMP-binding protein n=3 Tax=Burkholderia TaxID=32008 RepID=UPI0012DA751C